MQDRLFVTVATASPMTEAQVDRLRAILEKRYGVTVDLAISVDPTLIGGFRLRAGLTAIDASLATTSALKSVSGRLNEWECSSNRTILSCSSVMSVRL